VRAVAASLLFGTVLFGAVGCASSAADDTDSTEDALRCLPTSAAACAELDRFAAAYSDPNTAAPEAIAELARLPAGVQTFMRASAEETTKPNRVDWNWRDPLCATRLSAYVLPTRAGTYYLVEQGVRDLFRGGSDAPFAFVYVFDGAGAPKFVGKGPTGIQPLPGTVELTWAAWNPGPDGLAVADGFPIKGCTALPLK
jgi:hypothetical protein